MEKCRRMKGLQFVIELDIFLTMKVLEDTPAVLSFGKLFDEHGYSDEWIEGQKPHLTKNRCTTNDFVRNLRWITNNNMYNSSTATFFQNHFSVKITLRPEGKMPLPSPDVKFQGWWCLRKCFTFCRRTHLLHAHFLRTARSLRTSHTSHACHIHAWLKGL